MEQVLKSLYVGNDMDFAKVGERPEWSVLRCCKEGPGGHRDTLGYTTQGAPSGATYLVVVPRKMPPRMALNFIDPQDPNFIPYDMILKGLRYIHNELELGQKVLVACNHGHSRGPATAMLYLRAIGELPHNFITAERVYRTLCTTYDPGIGMRTFARKHWNGFEDALK